jgi:hypothetical protein
MDPVTICGSILQIYTILEERYNLMQEVETNWRELMQEVFSYKGLISQKSAKLAKMSKEEADADHHMAPIIMFNQSISGLCLLLQPIEENRGFFKRTYAMIKNLCATPENADKLRGYASKISRAAALISLSTTVELKDQVAGVESKVDALISNERELMIKLDAALAGYREEKNPELFAKSVSVLLGRDIKDIQEDLRANQDELKQILGDGFAEIVAKMNLLLNKIDSSAAVSIKDPAASQFWSSSFATATSVPRGLMCQVGPCKRNLD